MKSKQWKKKDRRRFNSAQFKLAKHPAGCGSGYGENDAGNEWDPRLFGPQEQWDTQNWLWYRKEVQRALRKAGVVQRKGDHLDCEWSGRKLLPQPGLAWLIQSFNRNYHRQGTGQGQGKNTKSQGSPRSVWHQVKSFKTSMNQTWLCIQITCWGDVHLIQKQILIQQVWVGLRSCISKKLPGNANNAGQIFWVAQI